MTNALKQWAKQSTLLKRYYLWFNTKSREYLPDWKNILAPDREFWQEALQKAKDGPPILVATSLGGHQAVTMVEMLLAASLTMHGANVHVLLCDEVLPACMLCSHEAYPNHRQFAKNGPFKDLCKSCFQPAYKVFKELGVQVHRYSEFLTPEDRHIAERISVDLPFTEIAGYRPDGIAVGEHALAGALRFFARGTLEGEPLAEPILRRYLKAALLTDYAARRLLRAFKFDCAVFHHGIYVPQGIIGEICRRNKVRVVNWNPAYRKQCFIFSHSDTYHHTLMKEPESKWENIPWNQAVEKELADYLKSRWHGANDWIWFNRTPDADLKSIERQIGVDFSKPCIGLLTNVIWDAQLHYPANAFPNMVDWLIQTVDYFSRRPELQLLIRVHPAEVTGSIPSRQRAVDEIRKVFPTLPGNIFIIPPESAVSTYAAMAPCNAVIIYGTKTGVELASAGARVIVAGEAWVRNKGITMDAASQEEYFHYLDLLPFTQTVDAAKILRARKYAYHFFFRRMIPIEYMEPSAGKIPYHMNLKSVRDLVPGRSRGLDIVCEAILKGTDFIYPAEKWPGRNTNRSSD